MPADASMAMIGWRYLAAGTDFLVDRPGMIAQIWCNGVIFSIEHLSCL